jgi:uncharacterized protein YdeI (YjbR/CyaY-like superfamily)
MKKPGSRQDGREVAVPPDVKRCLTGKLAAAWKKLSYSHQREWVDSICEAKKAETRERRIDELLSKLA